MEELSRDLGNTILGLGTNSRSVQRDYNHADDSQYKNLRAQAEKEQQQQQQLVSKSKHAYDSGDKAGAKQLSDQAKMHAQKAQDLNAQAAHWVFRENNADSGPDEIDLHGLFVREALSALDARVGAGVQRNESQIQVIVGKGIHSEGHIAKLKPAVVEYCQKQNLQQQEKHGNAGVIVVKLPSGPQSFPAPGTNVYQQSGQQNYNQNNNNNGSASGYYGGQSQGGYGGGYANTGNQNYGNQNYGNQNYGNQNYGNQNYNQNQGGQGGQGGGFQNINANDVRRFVRIIRRIFGIFRQCL